MYSQITANKRKTVLLIVIFLGLIAFLAWVLASYLGNPRLTRYVLAGAVVYVIFSYYTSSKVVLKMNGATKIAKKDNPRLYRIVENLAMTEGLPMPKVYIIDDPAPNALATGHSPESASVATTTGLLDLLNDKELQGVMAHEMGHIKNYDMRVSIVAFALVSVVAVMSDVIIRIAKSGDDKDGRLFIVLGLLGVLLAPIAASLIQLSISRKREYLADASGALTTRYPDGLASALSKIESFGSVMKRQNPSTAHLFFANPLKGSVLSRLFNTHPPTSDRIERLKEMGEKL